MREVREKMGHASWWPFDLFWVFDLVTEMSSRFARSLRVLSATINIWGGAQSIKGFETLRNVVNLGCLPILPNQLVRNQWNYQQKMERHFSVETKFPTEIFTTSYQSRAGNENFWKWNGSFGRSGPTGQRHMTYISSQLECPEMRLWEEDRNAPIRDIKFEAHVSWEVIWFVDSLILFSDWFIV